MESAAETAIDPLGQTADATGPSRREDPPGAASPHARGGLSGRFVGHYRIDELLGQGGMGAVYRAWDTSLLRPVALKTLLVDSETARLRFLREARAQARLRHPHVVPIHAAFEDEGCVYLVMDFVEGEPLDARLARKKVLGEREALGIIDAIASALEAAQEDGLVHRDVKPANVLVEASGRVLLADFGLAKALARQEREGCDEHGEGAGRPHPGEGTDVEPPSRRASALPTESGARDVVRANELAITRIGGLVGTPAYMAPEQTRGEAVDHRGDMYALGATLYELLTGEVPIRGASIPELFTAIAATTPSFPPHSSVRPRVQTFVLRLLAKSPDDRFSTYRDLRAELAILRAPPAPRAPTVARMVAFALDFVLTFALARLVESIHVPAALAWVVALGGLVAVETRFGRGPGLAALGLCLESDTGMPITPKQATVRAAIRMYSPVLAFLCFSERHQLQKLAAPEDVPLGAFEGLLMVTSAVLALFWVASMTMAIGESKRTLHDRLARLHVVSDPSARHARKG